jgi:hypothetical protein
MTKRYIALLILHLLILPGLFCSAYAQRDTTKLNQQVEVVKAYRPSVSNAEKINLLPEINDTTRFRPDLNYTTIGHPITSGFQSSALKASDQFQREISYPGYGKISGGFGTNLTPFFDFYLSNPNSQNGTLGIQINHLSSQGSVKLRGGNTIDAPFSHSRGIIYGSYVVDGVTIASELSYQRDMNRFYGYPVAIPSTIMTDNFVKYFNKDQQNQLGAFALSVKSNASSSSIFKFNTGLNLSYFNTSTDQVEKAIRLRGDFGYEFSAFLGKLTAGFDHFETENVTDSPEFQIWSSPKSSWIQISPSILFQKQYFSIEAGLNIFSVFDDYYGNRIIPYPKAMFSLRTASGNFSFYAGLDGYLQNNNYSRVAEENRWINPTLYIRSTNHKSVFSGGIKGKMATPLAFNLGIKYGKTEDQHFYVTKVVNRSGNATPGLNDLTYNNAFEVAYDNLTTVDFSGDLSYTTANLFMLLSGHFYSYQTTNLEKAPYMPDFTINASSSFKVTEKIGAVAELNLTGPRNVMLQFYWPPYLSSLPPPPIYLKTDAMIEANLGVKYQLIKNLELTGRIENLLNRKDEPWYGYTAQGILFKLGASFSF